VAVRCSIVLLHACNQREREREREPVRVGRSLDAVRQQSVATVAVAAHHHDGVTQGRVRVDRVPLNSVADEVVVVRSALVVDAVEVRLKTAAEPPRPVVVLRAVVIETDVVVAATSHSSPLQSAKNKKHSLQFTYRCE